MKSADSFQLKRAHFDRQHIEWFLFARYFGERFSDVPASDCSLAARVQHLGEQFGRRCFAVCAGNGDDWNFTGPPTEFELADYVDLARVKVAREPRGGIDTRTYDSQLVNGRIVIS